MEGVISADPAIDPPVRILRSYGDKYMFVYVTRDELRSIRDPSTPQGELAEQYLLEFGSYDAPALRVEILKRVARLQRHIARYTYGREHREWRIFAGASHRRTDIIIHDDNIYQSPTNVTGAHLRALFVNMTRACIRKCFHQGVIDAFVEHGGIVPPVRRRVLQ